MAFLDRIDKVEFYKLYPNVWPVSLQFDSRFVGGVALVVEHNLPRQLPLLILAVAYQGVKLHANRHVPPEGDFVVLKPHVVVAFD